MEYADNGKIKIKKIKKGGNEKKNQELEKYFPFFFY
jgi:hypothetical protein